MATFTTLRKSMLLASRQMSNRFYLHLHCNKLWRTRKWCNKTWMIQWINKAKNVNQYLRVCLLASVPAVAVSIEQYAFQEKLRGLLQQGETSLHESNLKQAEKFTYQALGLVEENFQKNIINKEEYITAKSSVYQVLSVLLIADKDYEMSEKILRKHLKLLSEQGMSDTDTEVLKVKFQLVICCFMNSKKEEADSDFKLILTALEKKSRSEENPVDCFLLMAKMYKLFAKYRTDSGDYEEGEKLFLKALVVIEEVQGVKHPEKIATTLDLVTVKILQKEYASAKEILQEVLEVAKSTGDEKLPVIYCYLGTVYRELKDSKLAKECFDNAKQIASDNNDSDSVLKASAHLNRIISKG